MWTSLHFSGSRFGLVLFSVAGCFSASAQHRPSTPAIGFKAEPITVNISVRDSRGVPLESSALVRLHSAVDAYDVRSATREGSTAVFSPITQGEYEVEVDCIGFEHVTEHISVRSFGGDFRTYIYLQREGVSPMSHAPPSGITLSPKLQSELEKGLDAMRKHQYDSAESHFLKATRLAPNNSDAAYLLGTAELGLQHNNLARSQFETALRLEPTHEGALLALGELQLQSGETAAAIKTLEQTFLVNGAGWRTHLFLAIACAKSNQWQNAETHAERSVALADTHAAFPALVLGQIQLAQGREEQARSTWQHLITQFPEDPAAAGAKQQLASLDDRPHSSPSTAVTVASAALPLPVAPAVALPPVAERPWAPPDVDSIEHVVANSAPCQLDDVLARASARLNSQLSNLEKFTATERIEHQEVDRYGIPRPVRSRDFSYIIFVHSIPPDSYYLEESRNGSGDLSAFPTSLATTGLLGLGVAVLQPLSRNNLSLSCEGLTNIRGQAAWLVHFVENENAQSFIREWRKSSTLYNLPIKGCFWLSATSFDLLRIETDLLAPQPKLELTRDHLSVDYGPVSFDKPKTTLWLPWSAEMFMELHAHRYHHKHYLTDYLLFSVDTSHKTAAPPTPPPEN
jgi:Flp pilus assembly protein TadD